MRRRYQVTFLKIALCALTSCVAIPRKDIENTCSIRVELDHTFEQALATANFEMGDWPTETWWEMFQDETLSQLIATALENNPRLKEAESRVRKAHQLSLETRSGLFPQVNAEADVDWQHLSQYGFFRGIFPNGAELIPSALYDINLGLDFTYEFDFWGKNRRQFRAALSKMQADQAEACQTKLILSTAVAEAYFHLRSHLKALSCLKKMRADLRELATLSENRFQEGIDSKLNPLHLLQEMWALDQRVVELQGEIERDHHLIALLLGKSPDEEVSLEIKPSLSLPKIPLPQGMSTDLLARRPDLMAQIWRLEAAAEEIGIAKTQFYPSLNLSAFAGLESITLSKLFLTNSFSGFLHPAIHLPIFSAGKLTAQLKAKEAEFDREVHVYQEMLLKAAQEVADDISLISSRSQELSLQKQKQQAAQERKRLIQARYENGLDNYLTLLKAQQEVHEMQLKATQLSYQRLTAILMLVRNLGGGYHYE